MTWRDAASVRIKLKVPATQRHHRERAALPRLLAISEVRFLYGLPTYIFFQSYRIFFLVNLTAIFEIRE